MAADVPESDAAEELAVRLEGLAGMLKVGLELFTAEGPSAVRRVLPHVPVFLDLKLHDIPATVRAAARGAGRLGVSMLTVHALGGPRMVAAAVEGARLGADDAGGDPPTIIGVTVLSSHEEPSGASPASLAFQAGEAGAGGVVVSGDHVAEVRSALGGGLLLVVPGIRPSGLPTNDHARVLTPAEAVGAGADYLVVGRPITQASDPARAARAVLAEMGE